MCGERVSGLRERSMMVCVCCEREYECVCE